MTQDTKTALLDCAEQAARARGIDGFSYADLALSVGIRKASIHYHFPTKTALASALMQRYADDLQSACAEIDHRFATGAGRVNALIDRYRQALDGGKRLCLCVAFSTGRDSLPVDVIHQMRGFRGMMIAWLEQAFQTARADGSITHVLDPKTEAAATLALLEGAQLAARAEENLALFDAALTVLRQRLDPLN